MRISTSMIYDLGVAGIQKRTSDLMKTNQQVASGRRILTPQDDPVGASRALELSQARALNQQHNVNTNSASSALELEDTVLASVSELIVDVRTTTLSAGGPLISNSILSGMATALRGRYQELLGLANSKDGEGLYMFSGYQQGSTPPFNGAVPITPITPGNVTYSGDQGQRLIQISPSRQIAVSDAGSDVFMQIKNGSGANESLFATLDNLITAIGTADVTVPGGQAALVGSLSGFVAQLDRGLDRVLQTRASVGTRLQEIDSIRSSGEDTALQYDKTLSDLQDLDYAKAITDLTRYQTGLEAAQKSFLKVQGLSLFNYM